MLDLKRLQVLHELARQGTLAKTAAALYLTPSAVSQQLTALQRDTGVTLLEHVGRGVHLTPEALRLVEHASAVFDRLELAESDLAAGDGGPRGTVRIASFHTVFLEIAPLALTILAENYPEVDVQLISREFDEGHAGLLSHEFDLVLGEEYPGSAFPAQSGIHREDFYTDPIRLVVPLDGAPTGTEHGNVLPRRLADLKDAPWALELPGTRIHAWTVAQCHGAGFEPRVLSRTPDPLLNIQLVRCGHAVAFVPSILGEAQFEGVVPFDLPDRPSRTLFTEVRAGRESHPALRVVREAFTRATETIGRPPAVHILES